MVEGSRRSGFQLPSGEEGDKRWTKDLGETLVTMRNISMFRAGSNAIFYGWRQCHELA